MPLFYLCCCYTVAVLAFIIVLLLTCGHNCCCKTKVSPHKFTLKLLKTHSVFFTKCNNCSTYWRETDENLQEGSLHADKTPCFHFTTTTITTTNVVIVI